MSHPPLSRRLPATTASLIALMALSGPAQADQVFFDDLIVDGSACIGFDCVNGENFSFTTLKLKENNLRIEFEDTSSSASFPSNDWLLAANETSNGGANRFMIIDGNTGRTVFAVEGAAPSNALYVDDGGRVGIRTSIPTMELHAKGGNTPGLRLEQDGSAGFAPQTFDVAANETNFFIRDATNGSRLPFRIRPGAPDNAIYIETDGNIGMGRTNPGAALHIDRAAADTELRIESDGGGFITLFDATNNDSWFITSQNANDGRFEFGSFIDQTTFNLAMFLDRSGDMTIDGTLTENSDKHAKMGIEPVDPEEVLEALTALEVSRWSYTDDRTGAQHMGPMAQDFHAAFGLGATETGISTLDTSGVAFAAIQALEARSRAQEAEIARLRAALERLTR